MIKKSSDKILKNKNLHHQMAVIICNEESKYLKNT